MGILGKFAFWKKKDELDDLGKDFGLDKDFGMDMGAGPSPDLGMGLEPQGVQGQQALQKYPSFNSQGSFSPAMQQPSFSQPAYSPPSYSPPSNDNYIASKNLEVISSKLDALKASIDALNQRVANIEAIARGEQEDQRSRRRYY